MSKNSGSGKGALKNPKILVLIVLGVLVAGLYGYMLIPDKHLPPPPGDSTEVRMSRVESALLKALNAGRAVTGLAELTDLAPADGVDEWNQPFILEVTTTPDGKVHAVLRSTGPDAALKTEDDYVHEQVLIKPRGELEYGAENTINRRGK